MVQERWKVVWERSRAGRHTVVIGPDTLPPAPSDLQAAGRTEAAVEQYLAAVREAVAHGDARRAYGLAEQALTLLDTLPASPPRVHCSAPSSYWKRGACNGTERCRVPPSLNF